jgi:hypothetical protein
MGEPRQGNTEYLSLFEALYEAKIEYLICGGLAVNIYGIPRMTADIDLLINFSEKNIERFDDVADKLDFMPQIPVRLSSLLDEAERKVAIKEKNLIAFSYYNTRSNYMNLDVMIDVPISFNDMWSEREVRKVQNIEVYIVSLRHLIGLKKYANRKQDIQDILLLQKLSDQPQGWGEAE